MIHPGKKNKTVVNQEVFKGQKVAVTGQRVEIGHEIQRKTGHEQRRTGLTRSRLDSGGLDSGLNKEMDTGLGTRHGGRLNT